MEYQNLSQQISGSEEHCGLQNNGEILYERYMGLWAFVHQDLDFDVHTVYLVQTHRTFMPKYLPTQFLLFHTEIDFLRPLMPSHSAE